MKYLSLLVLGGLVWASFAFAGSDSSGGGHVVVYKDDTVVLADPFIIRNGIEGTFHCKSGERGDFSPELKEEIRHVGSIMARYGAAIPRREKWSFGNLDPIFEARSKFVEENVFRDAIEYCFVDELPHGDTPEKLNVPVDAAEVRSVGYTEGIVTWIKKDLFKRMNLRNQARLIVHQRLHAIAGNVPHGPILAITDGIKLATEFLYAQEHGERPVLSGEQMRIMTDFVQNIADLELARNNIVYEDDKEMAKNFLVWRRGGGLVHKKSVIAPTAYVGVASVISDGGFVYDGADIINTPILDLPRAKTASKSKDSIDRGHKLVIGNKAFLKNAFIGVTEDDQFIFVGANSVILNSLLTSNTFAERSYSQQYTHYTGKGALYQRGISIGEKVFIGKTDLMGIKAIFFRDKAWMSNVHLLSFGHSIYATDLELKEGASIVNLKTSHFWPSPKDTVSGAFAAAFLRWGDGKYRSLLTIPTGVQLDFLNNYICYSSPMDYKTQDGDFEWKKHALNFIGEKEASKPADLQSDCR